MDGDTSAVGASGPAPVDSTHQQPLTEISSKGRLSGHFLSRLKFRQGKEGENEKVNSVAVMKMKTGFSPKALINNTVIWIGKKTGKLLEADLKTKSVDGQNTTEKVYISVKSFFKRTGAKWNRSDAMTGASMMKELENSKNPGQNTNTTVNTGASELVGAGNAAPLTATPSPQRAGEKVKSEASELVGAGNAAPLTATPSPQRAGEKVKSEASELVGAGNAAPLTATPSPQRAGEKVKSEASELVGAGNAAPLTATPSAQRAGEKVKSEAEEAAARFSKDKSIQKTAAYALEILMSAPKTVEDLSKALEAAQNNLRLAGLTGRLVTRIDKNGNPKVRVVVEKNKALGEGGFKKCHLAIRIGGKAASTAKTGVASRPENYKVKVTFSSAGQDSESVLDFQQDVSVSKEFSENLHDNKDTGHLFMKYKTVTHYNPTTGKDEEVLMADFAEGGELFDKLDQNEANKVWTTPEERTNFCEDLLTAGAALEAAGVVHRDIKPENLFIKGGRLVVADFGLAKHKSHPYTSVAGTPGYIPSWRDNSDLNNRQDAYAIGMVLLTMTTSATFYPDLVLANENSRYPDQNKLNCLCAHLRSADLNSFPMAAVILSLISPEKEEQTTTKEAMERFNLLKANAEVQGKTFNSDLSLFVLEKGGPDITKTPPKQKNPALDEFGRKKKHPQMAAADPSQVPPEFGENSWMDNEALLNSGPEPEGPAPLPPTESSTKLFSDYTIQSKVENLFREKPAVKQLVDQAISNSRSWTGDNLPSHQQALEALRNLWFKTPQDPNLDNPIYGVRWSARAADFVLDVMKVGQGGQPEMIEVTLSEIAQADITDIHQAAINLAKYGQLDEDF